MKKLSILFMLALSFMPTIIYGQSQPVSYFGAIPDLKVSGKEFVDPTGKAVTLHGVMDTPNCYFNGGRWGWINYNSPSTNDINACKNYFTKVYEAITKKGGQGSTYCNLFRLHLDPAWLRDPSYTASGFTNINDNAKTATDPNGHNVFDEANICHFSFDKMRTRMQDLYVPLIKDALAHGLYVVVRPPGVFPEDVKVGDYYNTYLTTVWDIVSSDSYIKENSGKIMLELGNEPVRMSGTLADYFQPIVNKIRQNGFTGIILLPGTSYQADYRSYSTKGISDSNFGYAVHNYPGWYGGWDANQTEASFISTFEAQVPIDKKPIVITEVDWSPMSDGKGHWNETHTQYTEANFGTWGTGTTNGTTSGVKLQTTQNIGWGLRFRHLVDKYPNISFTLQGTSTYVDMDAYMKDGTVKPAFEDAMKSEGYPDARQACSGYCFDWFYDFACGDRIPYGEVVELEPTGASFGNAEFKDGHYEFYTSTYSAFVFEQFKGTDLTKCAELTIELGEATIGYRLDIEILDKDGNSILSGDYLIGTEDAGTRITNTTDALKQTFNLQELLAQYIENGNKIGRIRLNTVVSEEDTNREGKYWFTIDKMTMNKSEITARAGSKGTSLADVKMNRHEEQTNYVYNNPTTLGSWINGETQGTFTNNNDGSYKFVVTKAGDSWNAQFNIGNNTYIDGTEYTLQLDIKGSVAGSIGAAIQKSDGYADRGNFPSIPVTTSWQTVTVKATVTGEGADRILLNYGAYVGTLDIKNIKVSYVGDKVTEITGKNIEFGEKTDGAEVFGADLRGNVNWNEYADLSAYTKMIIKGTGGSLRVLYNRPAEGSCPELNPSLESGEAVVDLTAYPYFHLNSIKAAWGQTVNVSSITLISGNGNNAEIADYYITGAGHVTDGAQAALNDVKATVIDATGLTNINPWSLSTANPNCLIIYKEDSQVGFTWNETTRNLVKNSGGYSAYRTNLYDGYDFRAPFAFNTVGGATYSRDLETRNWATIAIPFDLTVPTAEGAPEIYVLSKQEGDKLCFTKVTEGTIPAGSIILYYQETGGNVTLSGKDIIKTVDGFNIQPAGVDGWYTAQSYKYQVIEDVNNDPYLKDYDVYAVSENKFVHATKKLTLNPFRALYLKKRGNDAPRVSFAISLEDVATGIQENLNLSETREVEVYDVMGRRVSAPVKGITIIRMPNGTVRKVLNK